MSLVTVLGRTLGRGGGEGQAWQSGSLPLLLPSAFKGTEGQFMKKGFPVHSQVKDEVSALLLQVCQFLTF